MKKNAPTLGCCGIDCGLCPRYYTDGPSRCPGCCGEHFTQKHPSCSVATCCAEKKKLEVCAQCGEFPCGKFKQETIEIDSFVTHQRIFVNHAYIIKHGPEQFLQQQSMRMQLLRQMLDEYDDGRSKSIFCLAAALLSPDGLKEALQKAQREALQHPEWDRKNKAKILRILLQQAAEGENVELVLKKKKE